MITIIDSGICNIGSVLTALDRIGARFNVTTEAARVAEARALLLPGVGSFADGMAALRRHGLVEPIKVHAAKDKPLLGICLGMQLLADGSDEYGDHEGLGLIPGRVVLLKPAPGERAPNIGWCDVVPRDGARLFHDVRGGTPFYFVHSYHLRCADPGHVAATIAFGSGLVTAAVEHGNIFGLQCHPEKSQDAGLAVLDAFLSLAGQCTRHE